MKMLLMSAELKEGIFRAVMMHSLSTQPLTRSQNNIYLGSWYSGFLPYGAVESSSLAAFVNRVLSQLQELHFFDRSDQKKIVGAILFEKLLKAPGLLRGTKPTRSISYIPKESKDDLTHYLVQELKKFDVFSCDGPKEFARIMAYVDKYASAEKLQEEEAKKRYPPASGFPIVGTSS